MAEPGGREAPVWVVMGGAGDPGGKFGAAVYAVCTALCGRCCWLCSIATIPLTCDTSAFKTKFRIECM